MSKTMNINGKDVSVDVDENMPLLWFLRDKLELTGTKYGCGIAACGACTVHADGAAIRACVTPVSAVMGKQITTIEGLSEDGSHPLQKAWLANNVPQCGYCQAGQIMGAADFLKKNPEPKEEDIDNAMSAHICRCGTYRRIKKAILDAADEMGA
jgi:aerobic-type carbon monoxide dehydrogenase small subunit (CoxS/CutS family)